MTRLLRIRLGVAVWAVLLVFAGVQPVASTERWKGPVSGPGAVSGKRIVYIAEDLKNGGILGVGEGIREAADQVGWTFFVLDVGTRDSRRKKAFREAMALEPDGLILGGMDAVTNRIYLAPFEKKGIPVIGWHVGADPGPVAGTPVVQNITTDSLFVARLAAEFVVADAGNHAGVVIFTDSRFEIARHKAAAMAEVIENAENCSLLAVEDIALSDATRRMPEAVERLWLRFGRKWTHSLGINDLYFDHAFPEFLLKGGLPAGPPYQISAGDGSFSAIMRIRSQAFQKATVADPLLFQGWQIVDELNRVFTGNPPTGFVHPPSLITSENIGHLRFVNDLFDPDTGYRKQYRKIWRGATP